MTTVARTTRSIFAGASAVAVVSGLAVAWLGGDAPRPIAGALAQEPPVGEKANDVAVFMRAKLGHSQHVIEGLALADYALIARGAHDLALASQASSWEVLQTADYARHSQEFRRSCESLRSAAKEENLDGAALAWMEVTMKCIQCHKYVRDVAEGN